MKIGIDARFFGPESKGLGRYTQKLVEHLERIDHENDYVIFMTRDNIDIYTPKNPRFVKVLTDYRWYTFGEQVFFPWRLYQQRCDFIHFPHFNVPLLYRSRFIVTIHDLILVRYPTHKASTHGKLVYWFKYQIYKIVIAHAIDKASHIAAVSEFTKKDIVKQYNVEPHRINVTLESGSDVHKAYNDIDDDIDVLGQEKVLEGKKVWDKKRDHSIIEPYFLYVGNAYPHKNLTVLVDAFALFCKKNKERENKDCATHETYRLVLVGRRDYFYKELSVYIAQKNIPHVTILGTVSNERLHNLYRRAHAFVFASLYEGFGIPPLEACAYGIPVLSSGLSCMPEILGDAAHFCDVTSVQDLAQGLEDIAHDDDLRLRLQKKGPLQAGRYSWEKTAHQTHDLYKKMI